jgi:hypothetical protein
VGLYSLPISHLWHVCGIQDEGVRTQTLHLKIQICSHKIIFKCKLPLLSNRRRSVMSHIFYTRVPLYS